jgi:tetratricopeptide (TPR) repeat protein/tRNA A-37 threonylcarbamoyl transferase component Bud32
MSTDLRDRLQATLGSAYTLEHELGGGGMSRVFAATETALGRKVVVKVLPPELAEGVSVERFKREIQLAARLQHPHIVPVLSAGEMGGLPYYMMPLVNGDSLRTRLSSGTPLPIIQVVSILRDVAKALACAHESGVAHRDIKPENVLLTGGSAVVTDFGVAKALSASKTFARGETLTQVGTSLGTPAYMAPEQVAADPGTDHRADIYAFGVMAYEMLSGHPPFHGRSPQKLLAAQMGERPEPIEKVRADAPPVLAQLVMRCLEKVPDDRPQAATDLVQILETVTSGGGLPMMPEILLGGRRRVWRAIALYVVSCVVMALLAKAAIIVLGLPDWVFPGTLLVMGLGLPIVLFTAFVHHGAYQALTSPALTPRGTPVVHSTMTKLAMRASPWVSWRKTAWGGAIALGLFVVLVSGFMTTRALGIGPAGSLLGAGVLKNRARVLLTDFRSPASDSTLGPVVTEAFRTDLSQSNVVTLVDPARVSGVLERMKRADTKRLDIALAREVAIRDGIPAVIDGDVSSIGPTYVLSVRLVSADSGRELAAFRESAEDSRGVIPAIDRLSKRLRGKIGESLRTVRQSPPLEEVSTASLPALRKYVQAVHVRDTEGNAQQAKELLSEAIALDSGFAMAYRKLGVLEIGDLNLPDEGTLALQKALAYSGRLTEIERQLTIASYYSFSGERNPSRALAAYEAVLQLQPTHWIALHNAAATYYDDFANYKKTVEYCRRAIAVDSFHFRPYHLLEIALTTLGQIAERDRILDLATKKFPNNPSAQLDVPTYLAFDGHYDSAASLLVRLRNQPGTDQALETGALYLQASIATRQGRLAAAEQLNAQAATIDAKNGIRSAPLLREALPAFNDVWFRGEKARGLQLIEAALSRHPLDSIPPLQRPYTYIANVFALGGRPVEARKLLAQMQRDIPGEQLAAQRYDMYNTRAEIALAEMRTAEALAEFRKSDRPGCPVCVLPNLGRAYDVSGNADSAMAAFEGYLASTAFDRSYMDELNRAGIYKRLGELYEARGDTARAITNYAAFTSYWKNADPELQPRVLQAQQRLTRLRTNSRP